jgi:hypothetical protein
MNDLSESIQLTPSVKSIQVGYKLLSPYIKSLIGYKILPNFNEEFTESMGGKSLYINNIIKAAYKTLFDKFLLPQIINVEQNKIVITIPNVFTSRQKEIIKNIISKIFPTWEDKILFVSESDAVAYYYYFNRKNLDRDDTIQTNGNKETTVLVYDMGAGTLDLTLFHIDKENKLKILGRIGLTTAGNYLDTVLAEITFKQLIDEKKITLNENFDPVTNFKGFGLDVIKYKQFIKNTLKPALSTENEKADDTKIKFTCANAEEEFKLSDIALDRIKGSEEYNSYLQKVTERALELLKQNMVEDKPEISITKLIMTGRGSLVYGLKDKLLEGLESIFKSKPKLPFEEKFRQNPILMKSIAVEGSLCYLPFRTRLADKFIAKSIYAKIGVIINALERIEYHELISQNHEQELMNTKTFPTDKKGYEIDFTIPNVEEVSGITLIQTFLREEEVKTHLDNEELYDVSSVITEYKLTDNSGRGDRKLLTFICEDGEVFSKFGDHPDNTSPSIDIKYSESFKKSMWPIIS